jgi:hypothetical protein
MILESQTAVSRWRNNRAENSHQSTRRRDRKMRGFQERRISAKIVHDTGRQLHGKLSARPGLSLGFFEQSVFDEANSHRYDCAGNAAAGRIAKRCADVDPAVRHTAKGGDQALQDSSTNTSAHGARYRFEEGAQDNILEKAADGISANRPAHDLDNEVYNRSGTFLSPFWPSGSNDAGSPRFGVVK